MEIVTTNYLKEQAEAIRFELDQAGRNIVSVGLRLTEVKERLEHGQFEEWIKDEFGWTPRTAQKMMSVPRAFPELKNDNVFAFDKAALYLLSAPSTPEAARDEAKAKAAAGEHVSHKQAKEIVMEHKGIKVSTLGHLEPPTIQEPLAIMPQITPAPVAPKQNGLPTFDQAWARLSEYQRKALNGYPGSMAAAKRLFELGQGG